MSEIRVLTLFGEEIIPEQINAVGRGRAKKPKDETATEKPAKKTRKAKEQEAVEEAPQQAEAVAEITEAITEEVVVPTQEVPTLETIAGEAIAQEMRQEQPVVVTPTPKTKKTARAAAIKAATDEDTPTGELPENWNGDKQYYSIGEVAALFNVKTSNIRFWTKQFAMKVRTTRKGDRLYTPAQVREIRTIYHLVKEKKYTITGAKNKLKTQKNTAVQSMDVREALLQLRNKLVSLRNELM